MAKGKLFLGSLLGALLGAGLFVLSIYIGNLTGSLAAFISVAVASWLIGGFIAGLIATTPGKGALAGFLVAIFSFLLNSVIIALVSVLAGATTVSLILEFATLGAYSGEFTTGLLVIFILIGILIAFIFSAISAVPCIIAGLIGGAIRNPKEQTIAEVPITTGETTDYR